MAMILPASSRSPRPCRESLRLPASQVEAVAAQLQHQPGPFAIRTGLQGHRIDAGAAWTLKIDDAAMIDDERAAGGEQDAGRRPARRAAAVELKTAQDDRV